ncbi:MAG: AI-2E family transporter [Clostridium fessum]
MGMTAVSVIAVCILLWFSIQHWDVVSAGTRKVVKILAPILCGAVLTYLTAPAYNWVAGIVEKTLGSVTKNSKYVRGAARMLATAACLGLVIVLVVGMFQLMIPQLIESLIGIQDSFPLYVQNVYEWIQRILKNNPEIENMVLSSFENNLAVFQNWAEKSFTNIDMHRIGQIVTGLSSSVLGVLEFIKNWLIGLIVMVYLLNIKDTLAAQGKKIVYGCLNLRQANLVIEELRFINQMFGGFIIGKLVDSLIIGIICFIGVTILNMPFPMLLSVIIGVTNVIPFWTVHRCDTGSVPGILGQSAPVCISSSGFCFCSSLTAIFWDRRSWEIRQDFRVSGYCFRFSSLADSLVSSA